MTAHKSRLVRVMSEEEIVGITGTLPYATSIGRNWTGVEVHRYRVSGPSQTGGFRLPQLAIFLPHLDRPCRVRQEVGDQAMTKDVAGDAVTIAPAALTRRASVARPHELTAIFLDPLVFSEIAHAETGAHHPEIMPQFGIADPLIRSLGMTLDAEMRCSNPRPAFYAERLASTLASHIVVRYSGHVCREMRSLGAHWTQLRRCIEHIHANIDQPLPLDHLAMLAGMSKFHFAKSFRQAMGIPPHQYLVQARMEKARGLLGDEMMSLAQIASRVGYSDAGQFASQFRKRIGLSPAQYRRRHARQF
jgi:AraC family transcriptional regulator